MTQKEEKKLPACLRQHWLYYIEEGAGIWGSLEVQEQGFVVSSYRDSWWNATTHIYGRNGSVLPPMKGPVEILYSN